MIIDHIHNARGRRIYKKSHIAEIFKDSCDHIPKAFDDWKRLFKNYSSGCLVWITESSFVINHKHITRLNDLLDRLPNVRRNGFPQSSWRLLFKGHHCGLYLFATFEMEALEILHDMVQYSDFFECNGITYVGANVTGTLPTLLMKQILERVNAEFFTLYNIRFHSEFSGRVLATTGRNTSILFRQCSFLPVAQDAFVEAMTSKDDVSIGLTDIYMYKPYTFDDRILFSLLRQNAIRTLALYGYSYGHTPPQIFEPHSEEFLQGLLQAIHCSRSLRCLKIPYCTDFSSHESYASFVNRLRSESLRHLHIEFYGCHDESVPFPVDSLKELSSLTSFSFDHIVFNQTRWSKLLEVLGKCTMLTSLVLRYATWQEVHGTQAAVEFTKLLYQHSNIESLETNLFFDDSLYRTSIMPMLQYNKWQKKILSLYAYEGRNALVAEALGRIFATKPSQMFQLIKANTDAIASCLAKKDQQVLNACRVIEDNVK